MKPGLYVATVRGTSDVIVFGPDEHEIYATIWGGEVSLTGAVGKLRPLVVLDPESDEDCQALNDAALNAYSAATSTIETIRNVLRALAAPTPAEPMGLGAVARDADGVLWIRDGMTALPWKATSPVPRQKWSALDSPEVLSEGWSE